MPADTITALVQSGDIEVVPEGRLRSKGAAADVYRWLDWHVLRLAEEAGACPLAVPATIDRTTLERAGHFESFPQTALPAGAAGADRFVPPAVCYHCYPLFEGTRLGSPRVLTAACGCGRREARGEAELGRLWEFTMREVIFVGAPDWVAGQRDEWMTRARAFAAAAGLSGTIEPAADPFFGNAGRGRRLLQQLKGLKYELRMEAGSAGRLAVASFNLHESFFTRRFDIRLAGGSPASSGCAAFGLERWTLAYLAQRGPIVPNTPDEGGTPRSTTNT